MLIDIKTSKISKCVFSVILIMWHMTPFSLDHLSPKQLLSTLCVPCMHHYRGTRYRMHEYTKCLPSWSLRSAKWETMEGT